VQDAIGQVESTGKGAGQAQDVPTQNPEPPIPTF